MLLWFRNDLRSHDNPALEYFLKNNMSNAPLKAIFFISEQQWQNHDWSAIKIDFIKRHAKALSQELLSINIDFKYFEILKNKINNVFSGVHIRPRHIPDYESLEKSFFSLKNRLL